MENRIAQTNYRLAWQVTAAIAGLQRYELPLQLTFIRGDALQTKLDAFTSANTACKKAISGIARRQLRLRQLRQQAREFLRIARDVLKVYLGPHYNTQWIEPGFVHSLEIPRNRGELLSVLSSVKSYFQRNPEHENAVLNVSANQALAFITEIDEAGAAVLEGHSILKGAVMTRDAMGADLRRSLRLLIKELSMRMSPLDSRWKSFGLNCPGQKATPDVPENVEAQVIDATTVAVQWPRAARAEHYRVHVRVVGVDAEPKPAGSPKDRDFMIKDAPPGATLEIGVSAVNNGGESAISQVFTVVLLQVAGARDAIAAMEKDLMDRRV
jgi:hypothetical protein